MENEPGSQAVSAESAVATSALMSRTDRRSRAVVDGAARIGRGKQ